MECKVVFAPFRQASNSNWNISRMECKEDLGSVKRECKIIGIYPEWNVKCIFLKITISDFFIGIYPEWNVK